MNALLRCFFQIVPTQKCQHKTELRKSIFRAIAAGLTDELIELTGQIGSFFQT